MKALILAAGYAVRLQPLTLNTPKPLLEIAGRSMLDRILDKVVRIKTIDSIYIVTNDRFFEKFNEWLKSSKKRSMISLINDGSTSNETRLGAIRDLELAVKEKGIADDLLIIAGDNLFELDLGKFVEFSKARSDGTSIAVYDIGDPGAAAKKFGVVMLDRESRIVDFEEKPERPKTSLISTGIYYFPKTKIGLIERYINQEDKVDAPGHYIGWLSKKDKVYGYAFTENWYDIGDMDSYKRADKEYLERKG